MWVCACVLVCVHTYWGRGCGQQIWVCRFFLLFLPKSGNMCGVNKNAKHPLEHAVAPVTPGNMGMQDPGEASCKVPLILAPAALIDDGLSVHFLVTVTSPLWNSLPRCFSFFGNGWKPKRRWLKPWSFPPPHHEARAEEAMKA